MAESISSLLTTKVSGLLELRNVLIDYLVDPLQFNDVVKAIQFRLSEHKSGFAPCFTFSVERGSIKVKRVILTTSYKDTPLFSLPLEVIPSVQPDKKIAEYLIFIEHLKKSNCKIIWFTYHFIE